MTSAEAPPDVDQVLENLAPFQRATVEHAFAHLYDDPHGSRRFLVADEVGLGKTLVAKGLAARAIEHLWNSVDRIDIVYICSNLSIAEQNLARLNPYANKELVRPDRLTMLPVTLLELEGHRVNLVALTPGTSFEQGHSTGIKRERALLYGLLREAWDLHDRPARRVLAGNVGDFQVWSDFIDRFLAEHTISNSLANRFWNDLEEAIGQAKSKGLPSLADRFGELCDRFARHHRPRNLQDRHARNELIGDLRRLLARSCVQALEPDLVILDEFQRFRHLLQTDSPAGELADLLFRYSGKTSDVRTLLLSATPYKMYTLAQEDGEEDHHRDFLQTVRFLEAGNERSVGRLRDDLGSYRRALFSIADDGARRLEEAKCRIEQRLRRIMCRTERTSADEARDAMLIEVPARDMSIKEGDIRAWVQLSAVAREVNQSASPELWKSAPYLLEFMEGYKLKRDFGDAILEAGPDDPLHRVLANAPDLLLPWDCFEAYERIPARNARLRDFLRDMDEASAWNLPWVPPTLPYYRLEGAFARAAEAGFTKRLVFSAWTVVPRAIATLVTYEAERRAFRPDGETAENTPQARARRAPPLRFRATQGRLAGMPVLGLVYPSPTLARLGDPLRLDVTARELTPSREDVLSEITARVEEELAPILDGANRKGIPDETWYWAAPILLDRRHHGRATRAWWERKDLPSIWAGESLGEDEIQWPRHVQRATEVLDREREMGPPPDDLAEVLAKLALAGPATVALRSLSRVLCQGEKLGVGWLRDEAARVGWSFRSLWNRLEIVATTRATSAEDVYWKAVLDIGSQGCLTALLDEQVHLLRELLGQQGSKPRVATESIGRALREALSLRSAVLDVHQVRVDDSGVELARRSMRTGFAARFAADQSEDSPDVQRREQLRTAFDSPFPPFVLCTTSVGQEGLDFHPWCHAVVHWNLPSNPVDLEQREGRVHRYKGHAVRKNVARMHATAALSAGPRDPWHVAFMEAAKACHVDGSRGLAPRWIYPVPNGASIERHVPNPPLAKEESQLPLLRRSLALYRMVLGQPRQDDLIEFLLRGEGVGRDSAALERQINLSPNMLDHRR